MSPLPSPPPLDFGFGRAAPSAAAAQRACLGRGLVFVLLLAASSLASIYAPYAFHRADWVEGTAVARP